MVGFGPTIAFIHNPDGIVFTMSQTMNKIKAFRIFLTVAPNNYNMIIDQLSATYGKSRNPHSSRNKQTNATTNKNAVELARESVTMYTG